MTELDGGVERLHDLLIKRALWGIDTGESRELARLGLQFPDEDLESVDATVAMLDAIDLGPTPPLPLDLREAIDATVPRDAPADIPAPAPRPSVVPWLAAAALAVVAVAGWWRPASVDSDLPTVSLAPGEPLVATLMPGDDPNGARVGGKVTWQPVAQRGELELYGLEINDSATSQYQLWIHDAQRDERFPVFGGVFDVTRQGNQTVLILPAMPVRKVTKFTITLEDRGGAVVSEQPRLAVASLN